MADYKQWRDSVNRKVYHEGQWQWKDGEYTVTRTHQWSAPGCHNACGVLFYTKNGKLEKVEGDPLNPFNNGKLCMRCLNLVEAVNHPDRLKYPMKRAGERGENKWERISWDEAYGIIEEKVTYIKKNYGGESIIGVHGTGRNINWQLPYFYQAAFDSPNTSTLFFTGFACYLPRIVGSFANSGDFMIVDASMGHEDRFNNPEFKPPACVVVWGNDPLKSNADGFLGHWLVQLMQMGTKLIVIDPRLTWLAARADYWLQIRPGTDAAMALAWLNIIIGENLYDHEFVDKWCHGFPELAARAVEYPLEKVAEICDVPAEKIAAAARLFAKAKPAAIQWGLAFDQQVSAMQAILGVADLWSITGNVDVPGGMLMVRNAYDTHRNYNCGQEHLSEGQVEKRLEWSKSMGGNHMVSCASSDAIVQAMETGKPYPIKMLWIQSSNGLACAGMDSARCYENMRKMEFNVVADPFMTPTAIACADLVLPVAMGCERNSVRSWWTPLRAITKVSQYYEAKSDEEIVVEVGKRLNPAAFPFKDDKEFIEWYITKDGTWTGTWEDLRNQGWSYWDFDATYSKYEKGLLREDGEPGFNTATGKIELSPTMAEYWGIDPLPYHTEPPESPVSSPELYKEYPLILTTGGRSYEFFHSEHRQLPTMREFHPDPLVQIHPETAAQYDIKEGDWVWIENQRGRIKQKAALSVGISPKVVHVEHGWWFPEVEGSEPTLFNVFDSNANVLTTQQVVGDGGLGAPIKALLCKIYKVEAGSNDQVMPSMQITRLGGFK